MAGSWIMESYETPHVYRPVIEHAMSAVGTWLALPRRIRTPPLPNPAGQRPWRPPSQIAAPVGCTAQTVRSTLRASRAAGAACLCARSSRPQHTQPLLADTQGERRRALWHQSPRVFGKSTRRWTLALLAAVGVEQGLTPRTVSIESIRRALQRLGVGWKRAQHWITSPDPRYRANKSSVIG